MSSTNKTTNYELSQYIGSDKPTFLGDYNSDMAKIDAGMQANKVASQTANANATTANQNASDAVTIANTASTNANDAKTQAQNASSLASQANINSQTALNEIALFNLNNFETITNFTTTIGSIISSVSSVKVAKNNDGSLAKIYGNISVNTGGNTNQFTVSFQTSLRPQENITFDNSVLTKLLGSSFSDRSVTIRSMTLNTNGIISINASGNNDTQELKFYLLPFLYFINDFGDSGNPE